MAALHFVLPDGRPRAVEAQSDQSVMEAATGKLVPELGQARIRTLFAGRVEPDADQAAPACSGHGVESTGGGAADAARYGTSSGSLKSK